MNFKHLSAGLLLIFLVHLFTADAQQRHFGFQRGRNFGRGLAGLIGTAAVVKGAFLLGTVLAQRGKRSADDWYEDDIETDSVYEEILGYFDLAMEMDEDTCVEKTLCEIMSSTETKNKSDKLYKVVSTLFTEDSPLMGQPGHEKATAFLMSGYFGKNSKSKDVCAAAFKLCKRDSESRMKQMEEELELVQKYTE